MTVHTVHREDVPPSILHDPLPYGQQHATQRELHASCMLWRKREVRPPIDEAGAPADADQQVRAVAYSPPHRLAACYIPTYS